MCLCWGGGEASPSSLKYSLFTVSAFTYQACRNPAQDRQPDGCHSYWSFMSGSHGSDYIISVTQIQESVRRVSYNLHVLLRQRNTCPRIPSHVYVHTWTRNGRQIYFIFGRSPATFWTRRSVIFDDPFHGRPKSLQVTGSIGTLGLLNAHHFSFTTLQTLALPLGKCN